MMNAPTHTWSAYVIIRTICHANDVFVARTNEQKLEVDIGSISLFTQKSASLELDSEDPYQMLREATH